MKTCVLGLFTLAVALGAVEEKATVEKSFAIANPQSARVEVDNIWGNIHVTGAPGREVRITARQTISADTKEKIEEARQDVKLDITQKGDTVRLYVDGPFRCNCNCREGSSGYRGRRRGGYKVTYDFEIQAPAEASVFLHTVNDGEIRVAGIGGDYDVENINGGIEFLDAAGSGRVYALNGGVKVTFKRNPKADSYFGSLNGAVDLYFQPDLSADLRMKTFNGGIYSDFPVTTLPVRSVSGERRDGKFVFKADKFARARIANGGPEITLDGFNGDIRIRSAANERE